MRLGEGTTEIELIARALQSISKETSYEGLAKALLDTAFEYSGAVRGAVLLSEEGELLAEADASFPRERSRCLVSQPAAGDFRLPPDLNELVLVRQKTVIRREDASGSALIEPVDRLSARNIDQLYLPLIHRERTIGVLYIESEGGRGTFGPERVSVMSMLASQAAISFQSVRLFEALRETNMWMVKGQQMGRMGSFRWNTRTLLSRASRECYRMFDMDLDINPVPFEVFKSRIHDDDYPALEQALTESVNAQSPFKHEYRVVQRDGTTLSVVAMGQYDLSPTGDVELEGIITDVTEHKAAEQALADARQELARATRLASLGELAGSIVHEINQPLTGIIMSAEACVRWLGRGLADPDEARQSAMRVIEQGHRASDIIAGLRYLVRDMQLRFTSIDINGVIEQIVRLSKRDLERAGVVLRRDLDKSFLRIEADRIQIQQVILNIVRNAIEAMAGVEGRSHSLTVSSRSIDDYVCVKITDTGVGVDPANTERIFDALYTTKKGGLGLGLSICRKIIRGHHGRLWVEENAPHGTTFAFMLPLIQSVPAARES